MQYLTFNFFFFFGIKKRGVESREPLLFAFFPVFKKIVCNMSRTSRHVEHAVMGLFSLKLVPSIGCAFNFKNMKGKSNLQKYALIITKANLKIITQGNYNKMSATERFYQVLMCILFFI